MNVNLDANGGGIGASGNDVEIDSSVPTSGRLAAEADGDIYLTEIDSTLNVVLAQSLGGSVRLTVRESSRITSYNVCYTKLLRHGGRRRRHPVRRQRAHRLGDGEPDGHGPRGGLV